MSSPVLWGPTAANNLQSGIQLGGYATVYSGNINPSSVATPGNAGDIYISTSTNFIYQKTDNGTSTNWSHVGAVSSVNGSTGAVTVNAINQLTGDVTTSAASGSQSEATTIAAIQGTTVSGVTGGGNVVFSANPVFTGTINGANIALSGHMSAVGTISGSNLTSTGHASLDLQIANNLSDVASTSTAFANISPLTTKGDIIYENATPAPARLAIGSTGQVLTVSGGLPVWGTGGATGTADISATSFTGADNQSSAANVTGLAFSYSTVASFQAIVSVIRGTNYAQFNLNGVYTGSSWEMADYIVGNTTTGVVFSITAAGQVQYTSTSTGTAPTIRFRAFTV